MTRDVTKRRRRGSQQRDISVRDVRRETPDLRKLSRAVIQLAMAQAAAEAAAQAQAAERSTSDATDTETSDD